MLPQEWRISGTPLAARASVWRRRCGRTALRMCRGEKKVPVLAPMSSWITSASTPASARRSPTPVQKRWLAASKSCSNAG